MSHVHKFRDEYIIIFGTVCCVEKRCGSIFNPMNQIEGAVLIRNEEYVRNETLLNAAESLPRVPMMDAIGDDQIEVLLRYDQIYRAFVKTPDWVISGLYSKDSLVDWSLSFAIQGDSFFSRLHWHVNLAMFRGAILLIPTMATYLYPPTFGEISMYNYYMTLMGMAAVANLSCIISYAMFLICCDRPYDLVDSMVSRVKNHVIYIFGMFFECKAVLTHLGALCIAHNNRVMHGLALAPFIVLLAIWAWVLIHTDDIQDKKVRAFHREFVDPTTGMLNDPVLKKIYRPSDLPSFLEIIGCSRHLPRFEGCNLADVMVMDKNDLIDLFGIEKNGSVIVSPAEKLVRQKLLADVRFIATEIKKIKLLPLRVQ